MNNSIQGICINFIEKVLEVVGRDEVWQLSELETGLGKLSDEFLKDTIATYLKEIDRGILEDKAARKKAGLVVERRDEERTIITRFGALTYPRAYYLNKQDQRYEHPVDQAVGIEAYERVSVNLAASLVNYATDVSYAKSSVYGSNGEISRQSVMNMVRKLNSVEHRPSCLTKKILPELHITADEDHVALQDGRNVQVPLIVVYEGLKRESKGRYRCIGARYFSDYGKTSRQLWEAVDDYIEEHYDSTALKKIYLHGDGAAWIKAGCELLPRCVFVLDDFHQNKALMRATGAQPEKREALRNAVYRADYDEFLELCEKLYKGAKSTAEKKRITEFQGYLCNNWESIEIKRKENCGGCCAEGQVSHVLSARLSSRPMGWSEESLIPMTILLSRKANRIQVKVEDFKRKAAILEECVVKAVSRAKKTLGDVDPDRLWKNYSLSTGKVTPLFRVLRGASM